MQRFQSHPGSISTRSRDSQHGGGNEGFNPTLVRLALIRAIEDEGIEVGFNPTLVRLAHAVAQQFKRSGFSFNPTLVRLAQNRCHRWV